MHCKINILSSKFAYCRLSESQHYHSRLGTRHRCSRIFDHPFSTATAFAFRLTNCPSVRPSHIIHPRSEHEERQARLRYVLEEMTFSRPKHDSPCARTHPFSQHKRANIDRSYKGPAHGQGKAAIDRVNCCAGACTRAQVPASLKARVYLSLYRNSQVTWHAHLLSFTSVQNTGSGL